jgi:predicted RecA/RadA family phage recombinase
LAVNEVFHDGDSLYLPVIAGVVAGGPVIVGMIPGVAETSRDAAGFATVRTKGVFNLSVTGAMATVGLPVYITSATGALAPSATGGAGLQLFGHNLDTKGAGAGVIRVRIAQFAVAVDTPA